MNQKRPEMKHVITSKAGAFLDQIHLMLLLGASKVDLVEKRTSFTRNNVLHLWSFLVHDLKSLGIKKFVGQFGTGGIDHISE